MVAVGLPDTVLAQGTFQNLDFEEANPVDIIHNPFPSAPVEEAFPYWTVTVANVPQTYVTVDGYSTGEAWVSLIGPGPVGGPIDGDYSALLFGSPTASSVAISQTGLIPPGTQSLFFEAQLIGPLSVSIGNQNISFAAVGTGPNYTIYGANVSAWGGDTEQLTFSAFADLSRPTGGTIDDISFSPVTITPEPSPLALTGIGGVLFALYRHFGVKRKLEGRQASSS